MVKCVLMTLNTLSLVTNDNMLKAASGRTMKNASSFIIVAWHADFISNQAPKVPRDSHHSPYCL